MQVGDLVIHIDGEFGLLLELNWKADFPYRVIFPSIGIDWFSTIAIEAVS